MGTFSIAFHSWLWGQISHCQVVTNRQRTFQDLNQFSLGFYSILWNSLVSAPQASCSSVLHGRLTSCWVIDFIGLAFSSPTSSLHTFEKPCFERQLGSIPFEPPYRAPWTLLTLIQSLLKPDSLNSYRCLYSIVSQDFLSPCLHLL